MKSIFRKSYILLLFYSVIFALISVGSALMQYRLEMLESLHMIDGNILDGTEDVDLIYKVLICLVVLLLLNVWSVMDYWIETRKKEIYIRKLCGAKKQQIIAWLMMQYGVLMMAAFFIAQVFLFLLQRTNFFLSAYLRNMNYHAVPACVIFLAISLLLGSVKLCIGTVRHWVKIRYVLFAIQMFVTAIVVLDASSVFMNYYDFTEKVKDVETDLLKVEYAEQIQEDLYPEASYEEFEYLKTYIEELTNGSCFSFDAEVLALEDVKSPERYMTEESFERNLFDVLYITEEVESVYHWQCSEGALLTKEDFDIENQKYIPVLLGNKFSEDYQVGDVIDHTYQIKGILKSQTFYLNPRWQGQAYLLDKTIVIPMECQMQVWGGTFLNQLNLIGVNDDIKEKICAEIEKTGLPEITFRKMTDQMAYISEDVTFNLNIYGSVTMILSVLCMVSQVSMMMYLVESRKREFSIRLMCGATIRRIGISLTVPIFLILLIDYVGAAVLLGTFQQLWIALACAVILTVLVMIMPLQHLYRIPLTELIKRKE